MLDDLRQINLPHAGDISVNLDPFKSHFNRLLDLANSFLARLLLAEELTFMDGIERLRLL